MATSESAKAGEIRGLAGIGYRSRLQGRRSKVSVWFDGEIDLACDLSNLKRAFGSNGDHILGVVGRMPGITSVELVGEGSDAVIIRTNEGLMRRTNISKTMEADRITLEFEEVYEAGSKTTVTSQISEEFTASDKGVIYRLVISDVDATGLAGFLYRKFGSSKTKKAFLSATKAHFEAKSG